MLSSPFEATIDAVIRAVSPGSGIPIDSREIRMKTGGRATFPATSRMLASTPRAYDPGSMAPLEILARDPGSRARAGVLRTAHGDVRTPAFVPLATKATVKGLTPQEVRDLGYDMVLGNTYHLFLDPGHERIKRLGGLHEFMRWEHPIITDSGGF